MARDRLAVRGRVDFGAIGDRGGVRTQRDRGIQRIDRVAGHDERVGGFGGDERLAQRSGVDLALGQGTVDTGEAPTKNRALADLHRRADEWREEKRFDQLEQGIGAKGAAGVYFQTEVHQAVARNRVGFHTASFASRLPGGQPPFSTFTQPSQRDYRTLNSNNEPSAPNRCSPPSVADQCLLAPKLKPRQIRVVRRLRERKCRGTPFGAIPP